MTLTLKLFLSAEVAVVSKSTRPVEPNKTFASPSSRKIEGPLVSEFCAAAFIDKPPDGALLFPIEDPPPTVTGMLAPEVLRFEGNTGVTLVFRWPVVSTCTVAVVGPEPALLSDVKRASDPPTTFLEPGRTSGMLLVEDIAPEGRLTMFPRGKLIEGPLPAVELVMIKSPLGPLTVEDSGIVEKLAAPLGDAELPAVTMAPSPEPAVLELARLNPETWFELAVAATLTGSPLLPADLTTSATTFEAETASRTGLLPPAVF